MSRPPVDLRSDTVTRPTAGMREAMATAVVGDDVYGDDPTVNELERRVAGLAGTEAALFTVSGTMANQLAIRVHAGQGDEMYAHRDSHIVSQEAGAASAIWGVVTRPLEGEAGRIDPSTLAAAIPANRADVHNPPPRLLCLESTFMMAGGRVVGVDELAELSAEARRHGLAVHLDGARLVNASVAAGMPLSAFAATADTVQFCLSKGLGTPVGSMLCGSASSIARAHRLRKILGGGWRQAGVLAAAGLYALDHHVERLADDHRRARALAEGLAGCDRVSVDPSSVETNMVVARLRYDEPIERVIADLEAEGILTGPLDAGALRLVTHLDIDDDALERAIAGGRAALGSVRGAVVR
ncbi:MAG: threonine aldolase [Gaiellales bacterium]|nr:threonine aldolase [Gaiellales bacterium]